MDISTTTGVLRRQHSTLPVLSPVDEKVSVVRIVSKLTLVVPPWIHQFACRPCTFVQIIAGGSRSTSCGWDNRGSLVDVGYNSFEKLPLCGFTLVKLFMSYPKLPAVKDVFRPPSLYLNRTRTMYVGSST